MKTNWKHFVGAAVALTGTAATAGEIATYAAGGKAPVLAPSPVVAEDDSSIFDNIWSLPTLYKGEGDILQKLSIIGRYNGQHYWTDADDQGDADGWDTRRWRIGVAAELFNGLTFKGELNLDHEGDRFFENVDNMTLSYTCSKGVDYVLGKTKPIASREYNTSAKYIKTLERSLLVSQVTPEKIWGGSVGTEVSGLDLDLGVFAGDLDGDWGWSEFDAGYLLSAAVTYNDVRLSYLYNDGDEGNNGAEDYDHIVSLSYVNYGKKGYDGLGIFTEALVAEGSDDGSAWGITVMPSYMISEQLEGVLRVHYAQSEKDGGLTVQSRYDRQVDNLASRAGDQYIGVYGGLNYYIYSDKLKVMTGIEYGSFEQDSGDTLDVWSALAGVRLFF